MPAADFVKKNRLLSEIRANYPELKDFSDEDAVQKVLEFYPMLRRRVVDDNNNLVWKGGEAQPSEVLDWAGPKEKDGDYNGTFTWKSPNNLPANMAPAATAPIKANNTPPHGVSGSWNNPPVRVSSAGAKVTVLQPSVQPISYKLPGLADPRSPSELPIMPVSSREPEGFEPDVPEGFEPDSTDSGPKSSHGASGSWKPSTTERVMEKVGPYLPSGRTAAQVIGGMGGVAVTGNPLGFIPGLSIGESAYQLANPEATPEDSALSHAEAIGSAMAGEGLNYWAEHPILPALKRTAKGLNVSSQTLITRGLNPTDRAFQDHAERGLSELKASERTVGPIKEVSKARQGLDTRTSFYNNEIKKNIIDPQRTITVPGSSQKMAEDQIAAIPSDYKAHNPEGYDKLVRKIQSAHPQDYTIGELDQLRSELSATQSPYYGKDVSGQLTMDSGNRAIDIARGRSARAQLYRGLDTYGLGGGEQAAEANRRIGSIIHFQDALGDKANASVAEKLPPFRRLAKKITSPLTTSGTDENLALALKRWKNTPEDIRVKLEPRVGGTVGEQQDLLPSDSNNNPLLSKPNVQINGDPEEEYLQLQRQKRIWNSGQPKVKPGQMNLQPTVIKNGGRPAKPLFGGKASSAAEVDENLIPPGSKLAFKSKGFYGDMYHYETLDGRVITLDHELSPEFTKTPVHGAYEPGTSHAGTPYKEPTPPPRLRKGQKKL